MARPKSAKGVTGNRCATVCLQTVSSTPEKTRFASKPWHTVQWPRPSKTGAPTQWVGVPPEALEVPRVFDAEDVLVPDLAGQRPAVANVQVRPAQVRRPDPLAEAEPHADL